MGAGLSSGLKGGSTRSNINRAACESPCFAMALRVANISGTSSASCSRMACKRPVPFGLPAMLPDCPFFPAAAVGFGCHLENFLLFQA
jgi:hypothetical protein